MKKKVLGIVGVVALVAALGVFGANMVFAQTATPPAQTTPGNPGTPGNPPLGPGFDLGFGGGSTAVFDAEAKALNLTPAQLFEQLHSGKTLSDIATTQGVDIQTVQNAAQAARTQATKDNIAQAVKDGRMTQAQADWLLEGLDKGYLNGMGGIGFGIEGGRGHGFGGPGRGPMGNSGQPGATAPAAPGTQSSPTPSGTQS